MFKRRSPSHGPSLATEAGPIASIPSRLAARSREVFTGIFLTATGSGAIGGCNTIWYNKVCSDKNCAPQCEIDWTGNYDKLQACLAKCEQGDWDGTKKLFCFDSPPCDGEWPVPENEKCTPDGMECGDNFTCKASESGSYFYCAWDGTCPSYIPDTTTDTTGLTDTQPTGDQLTGGTTDASASTTDGPASTTDASASTTTGPAPSCGDGKVDPGEQCDDGNNVDTDACTNACNLAICGDGFVYEGVEQCDTFDESDTCDEDCTIAACGDGKVNQTAGETCDDGANNGPGQYCNAECQDNVCGDGDKSPCEGCDGGPGCKPGNTLCLLATCGDGVVDLGEACDDGNNVDEDGCTNRCTTELCPEGLVNLPPDLEK